MEVNFMHGSTTLGWAVVWLAETGIKVVFGGRLDLGPGGVEKEGRRIVAFTTESGRRFAGAMFIDATYEGDLMAKAGATSHVGREAQAVYGESLNGIRTAHARSHQLYAREARRMVSDYVMTQADCQWKRTAEDPVGLRADGQILEWEDGGVTSAAPTPPLPAAGR